MASLEMRSRLTAWIRSGARWLRDGLVSRWALSLGLVLVWGACSQDRMDGIAAAFVRRTPERVADLFLTPDQQGRAWFEAGEPRKAARHFRDPLWKGLSHEKAGDFDAAADVYSSLDTPRASFRRANALARLERLPQAAAAYREVLALDPDFSEAIFNLAWVEGLIEVDAREYEDSGGTGGQLEADKIVFDARAADALDGMTLNEARAQGLSDQALREIWMRRVQTTPGEFLRLKFSYQAQDSTP